MATTELVLELEALLRETYALWEPGWVGFNWRGYTFDHVQRVRGLAVNLGRREGADETIIELAALLHDITKAYDGEYLTDENGKRLVDEHGYWICPARRPAHSNEVTELYDGLALEGTLHSESGALVADELLRRRGVDAAWRKRVAETICHHLKPPTDAPMESLCLYDADIIDANIGLPAFVRNIYINLHFFDRRKSEDTPPIAELLASAPERFLQPYVRENLPNWAKGKQQDFVPRLYTKAGRELSVERMQLLIATVDDLAAELPEFAYDGQRKRLDVLWHYMSHRDDPSIADETQWLASAWRGEATPPETRQLLERLQAEMAGRA